MRPTDLQIVNAPAPQPVPEPEQLEWWRGEIEAETRKLYAPEANDREWEIFKSEARSLQLDPRRKEFIALAIGSEPAIDANGRKIIEGGKQIWRKTYQGYITIHGARALAARTCSMISG